MITTEELLGSYIAAWNERDEQIRFGHLERCWSEDGTFSDPLIPELVQGRKQMNGAIGEMCARYVQPGKRFVRLTEVQEHHDVLRGSQEVGCQPSASQAGTGPPTNT